MSVEHRPPHAVALEREHAHELLRQMLLIRHFEEKSAELYSAGKIRGFLHLYIDDPESQVSPRGTLRGAIITWRNWASCRG